MHLAEHQGIGMTSQRARDRLCDRLQEMGIRSQQVLEVMRRVPRHIFLDEALASRAYENTALPIGHGQTISQPYTVARMTEALVESGPLERVLEVGGGCGYQTAVLSRLCREVYTIERLRDLVRRLRRNLRDLRIYNARVLHGDGFSGWPSAAPFDAILVAAAPRQVPGALLEQLKPGGRLVIPVGSAGEQRLLLIRREDNGFHETELEWVSFVPLVQGRG